jgi:hypothetical protein
MSGKILRRMGFQAECQGLIDRYVRVEGAWKEHLNLTREFITRAVAGRKFKNIAVLGSGWLLDVPLDQLAEVSGKLWLYDAIHPAQVLHKLRQYPNVTALPSDITGGCILNAWEAVKLYKRKGIKTLPEEICIGIFQPDPVPDYVISLNLLSQIGVMITGFLEKHIPYNREEIQRINGLLQQAHLKMLPAGRTCLITDVREINLDLSDGNEDVLELLYIPLPAAHHRQTWEWQFDPEGNYKSGKRTVLQVVAQEI